MERINDTAKATFLEFRVAMTANRCDYRMVSSIVDEVVALLYPFPDVADASGAEIEQIAAEREAHAEGLDVGWTDHADDPVLTSLRMARERKLAAELEMRRLFAYAREFVRPRPYTLAELAEAAGMSISGVRTAYDDGELRYVANAVGRLPRA